MKRTEAWAALLINLITALVAYASLWAVYEAVTAPEEVRECVSETGHKPMPCPEVSNE